ncbi:hypothetical protein, partial [Paramagnetospirillum kuznetsovii]|uniref:hypothetical protein n=1 Tax=Paramagnetospirillum kuznetsovii TaxID=2053833 RepID=UPI0019612818
RQRQTHHAAIGSGVMQSDRFRFRLLDGKTIGCTILGAKTRVGHGVKDDPRVAVIDATTAPAIHLIDVAGLVPGGQAQTIVPCLNSNSALKMAIIRQGERIFPGCGVSAYSIRHQLAAEAHDRASKGTGGFSNEMRSQFLGHSSARMSGQYGLKRQARGFFQPVAASGMAVRHLDETGISTSLKAREADPSGAVGSPR